MPFQKGQPKHPNSGRKPGVKNKKIIPSAYETLANRDTSPVERVLDLLPSLEPIDQIPVWLKLLEWIEPKAKAITGVQDTSDISDDDLIAAFDAADPEVILKLIKGDEVL